MAAPWGPWDKSVPWGGGGAIRKEPRVSEEGRLQRPKPVWSDSEASVAPNRGRDSKARKSKKLKFLKKLYI